MITKQLSDNLNLLMAKARINSSELARMTGLPATTIKRIRNHEQSNPTVGTLLPIAKYFSISISDLIGGELNESAIESYSLRKELYSVPLLSWQECEIAKRDAINQKKIKTERHVSKQAFALMVEERELEVFPLHSLLIVEPEIEPKSGDYVIVTKSQQGIASIRKYIVDADLVFLKSVVPGLGIVSNTDGYQILGVIVQYRVELK